MFKHFFSSIVFMLPAGEVGVFRILQDFPHVHHQHFHPCCWTLLLLDCHVLLQHTILITETHTHTKACQRQKEVHVFSYCFCSPVAYLPLSLLWAGLHPLVSGSHCCRSCSCLPCSYHIRGSPDTPLQITNRYNLSVFHHEIVVLQITRNFWKESLRTQNSFYWTKINLKTIIWTTIPSSRIWKVKFVD